MSVWLVNVLGFVVMAIIVWWFWLSAPRRVAVARDAAIDILVDGGSYDPARVRVAAGQPIMLRFLRKDASPCAEKVVFADLDISADLALDQFTLLRVTPPQPGRYRFTCQMGMYQGELIAE